MVQYGRILGSSGLVPSLPDSQTPISLVVCQYASWGYESLGMRQTLGTRFSEADSRRQTHGGRLTKADSRRQTHGGRLMEADSRRESLGGRVLEPQRHTFPHPQLALLM